MNMILRACGLIAMVAVGCTAGTPDEPASDEHAVSSEEVAVPGAHCSQPNERAVESCGLCGHRESICLPDIDGTGTNRWSSFSACRDEVEGGCVPGTIETFAEGCPAGTHQTRICSASCSWESASAECRPD